MKIISGGQTGADRAALDFALEHGIPCGGYCPAGRRAEDGPIDRKYPLTETESPHYDQRTRLNVEMADGTLIVWNSQVESTGTRLTIDLANQLNKPLFIKDLGGMEFPDSDFADWLEKENISVLNIAGPRASSCPGIYQATKNVLSTLLK